MDNQIKLSAVICAHNPRKDYMDRVLAGLRNQTLAMVHWELLVIDNASSTPLSQVYDIHWHPHARHIVESELGLTKANVRGIAESQGGLLVFVHDDTVLPPTYFSSALEIAAKVRCVGCFGAAVIKPEFEVEPEDEVKPYTPMLALRRYAKDHWSNQPDEWPVPWGAGLCVTRPVADAYEAEMKSLNAAMRLGRRGDVLVSGEDVEFSWVACHLGYAKGIFTKLEVLHLISQRRITREYLLRLWEGHAFAEAVMRGRRGREVAVPDADPSFASIGKAALSFGFSGAINEIQRWNTARNRSQFKRRLDAAWRAGTLKGLNTLQEQQVPENKLG